MSPSDLAQALPALAVPDDGFAVESERRAADGPAFQTCAAHAGANPFDDQAAFELGDSSDDDHDGPAQWAAGIDLFAETDELDVESIQFIKHFEEVAGRAGDSIASPDENDVEAAAAGVGHHLIEPWPARLRAADLVHILLHDFKAALGSQLTQVKDLRLGVLVIARNPCVQGGALHLRRPFGFGDEHFVT